MNADLTVTPQTLELFASGVSKDTGISHVVFLSSRCAHPLLPERPDLRSILQTSLLDLAGINSLRAKQQC